MHADARGGAGDSSGASRYVCRRPRARLLHCQLPSRCCVPVASITGGMEIGCMFGGGVRTKRSLNPIWRYTTSVGARRTDPSRGVALIFQPPLLLRVLHLSPHLSNPSSTPSQQPCSRADTRRQAHPAGRLRSLLSLLPAHPIHAARPTRNTHVAPRRIPRNYTHHHHHNNIPSIAFP